MRRFSGQREAEELLQKTFREAHPDQAMATVYHLDGDRLMLTHYGIAKNQPRLVAASTGNGEHR